MRDRPLSVCATDQEALCALLRLHAVPEPRILDCTANRGRMWKGLPFTPHRLDRDPALFEQGFTDTVADFRALPFGPAEFDVLVFDPPHIPDNAGAFSGVNAARGYDASQRWTDKFGTGAADLAGPNVSHLFAPFLAQARRVLVPDTGIVLAKIADQVHQSAYQWQHVDLILAAREAGFTACDLVIRVAHSRGGLIDPRWQHVYHVRSIHTFWLALRNGPSCCNPHAPAVQRPETLALWGAA